MDNEFLKYAYAGLLHDIGKFYQRTEGKSSLSESEKECTPIHKYGYHTHLHSGYTSRFFQKYLQMYNDTERASSSHHIYSIDRFDEIIKQADIIASRVDRNDEESDNDSIHEKSRYQYITKRLNSIMSEIDFGKERTPSIFPLDSIDNISFPHTNYQEKSFSDSVEEYKTLFQKFIQEVTKDNLLIGEDITPFKYHRMYALLYKYTTLIPASTYETVKPSVSLFDHLKLTSAIASCLYYYDNKRFYMVEFDVSGIQRFIYQITEGKEVKQKISKSLRGRSAFVSLLTNSITYSLLNEFSLTQANIIFNTGGGAIVLLPYLKDTKERVEQLFSKISCELYDRFNTNLTFVYAIEELDDKELELFKTEKALSLKTKLDQAKHQKFLTLMNDDFSFHESEHQHLCIMCGDNEVKSQNQLCDMCQNILKISDYYTSHDSFTVWYDFKDVKDCDLDLGFVGIHLLDMNDRFQMNTTNYLYFDAVNHFEYGNVKLIANLVPKCANKVLNFEDISTSLGKEYGDQKLGVLKMDVDNLGAIFAFGLKQGKDIDIELQRSLSKYLTLSRFIELFFSVRLKEICIQVSQQLQDKLKNIFYINYAGGDDLVIIGPIYGIVQLALEINNEFNKFVCNQNITLSGGIYIQNAKKPIRFGIKKADDALEASKNYTENNRVVKNGITIMGITVAYKDYETILEKVHTYCTHVMNNSISRTSFYNIMTYIQNDSLDDYYAVIPKIQYMLFRQLGDNPLRLEIVHDIIKAENQYDLNKIILMMKLVILFTREVN